eukprot:jgi/Psemu1/1867/gm1.1867_g
METKTSYSSVAAKPPPKANNAKSNGQQPKTKNSTAKRNPHRFVGHNQTDLKGILIPEDASAKHYNELKERLKTLRGSKYIPQVGSSIKHLAAQTVKIPGLKETLMDVYYKEELKKKANEGIQYQRDMEKQNNYPATSVEALDMLVAFKDSRNKTTDLPTDQHSQQLLVTAVGSERDNESDTTSSSSNVSSTTSTYSGNTSNNSDGVPDLVPRSEPDDNSTSSGDSKEGFHFSRDAEHLFIQSKSEGGVNPYWILLDSESSLNLIVNLELVTNIRQAPNGGFMNIHCNSGVSKTNLIANLPGFGVVWFYANGLANILSLALVLDQYRVTMDTSINNAIYVHKDSGTRRFQRSDCNLYYCDMQEHNGTVLALDTVEGEANSYSALDCSREKKARGMQKILGLPTSKELIKKIDNNIIKYCPITRRDIKVMSDIYGKHASILKGKSMRQQAPHTREDITPIPSISSKPIAIEQHSILGVDFVTHPIPNSSGDQQHETSHIGENNKGNSRAILCPTASVVMDKLEANALEQGMPTGLHDLDTEGNYDDDDASDQYYVNGPDGEDESLVSVIDKDEAIIDSHLADEHPPVQDDADNNVNDPEELGVDPEPEEPGVYPEPGAEAGMDATDHTPPPADNLESEGTAMLDVEEPSNDDPLRAATDDCNKPSDTPHFGSAKGYNPEYREQSSFTAGYSSAIKAIVGQHASMMMVLQDLESYNNMEATHVTKQCGVNQGIKIFGEEGVDAVLTKLQQLHDRGVIKVMDPKTLTQEMVQQSLQYLMFLKQKRTGKVKGQGCADGRPQREFITKEDSTSPTVSLYALMNSCMIGAIEGRDVATVDIPGAFLQTDMPEGEDVYIKLNGTMAELLC